MNDLAGRIVALERELAGLYREADRALRQAIAASTKGRAFSATELFRHRLADRELEAALAAARITSARQLGKRCRRLGLVHVGDDRDGAIWLCESPADTHLRP